MVTKKAPGICVQRKEAEIVRRYLRDRNLLRTDLLLKRDDYCIYFPVKEVTDDLKSYKLITTTFEKRKTTPTFYKELVKIPKELRDSLPTSYDIVGDIILLKLPEQLQDYQKEIGNALLSTHPNIKTICLIDPVTGELRTRKIYIVAGEKKTRTIHKEYGLSFHVDVQSTYFSPRLSSERRRVTGLVKPGEIIVDMFAGVAPFSIMIARYAKPKIVYAIDKNREAVNLALENVKQNHVLDTIEVIHGDAKDVIQIVPQKADRIIMNLPFSASQFFPAALGIAAETCIVHYYDIIREEEIPLRIESLTKVAAKQGFRLTTSSIHKIKTYAPREFYIGIDITATKHADVA
jgi:tRNA (guanine37-N1)-methyltransferase